MIRRPVMMLAATGLLVLTSCLRDPSTGELNNGKFNYLCVDSSDAACDGFSGAAPMPELIGVGAAFDLEYVGDTAGSAPVQVEPVSELTMSGASGHFKILKPGVAAVLSRNTSGVVADFIHLRGVAIDHLDVAGPSSTAGVTKVQMDTDSDVTLQVTAKAESGALLAGAVPYAWSTSDETIVSLGAPTSKSRAILIGHKAGTATIEVASPSGPKVAVVVTVKQGMNPGTTTSAGTGAGGSGGSMGTGGTGGAGGAGGGQ